MCASKFIVTILIPASLLSVSNAVFAEPKALDGKSVIVNWTEERRQRREGEKNYRRAIREGTFSAYVSDTGRIFNRISMMNPQRELSGKRDRVGNERGMEVTLSEQTMMAVQSVQGAGARSITMKFDENFTSCTAEVILGKTEGAEHIAAKSMIRPGTNIEIASVKTSGARCAVKDGNVFGRE